MGTKITPIQLQSFCNIDVRIWKVTTIASCQTPFVISAIFIPRPATCTSPCVLSLQHAIYAVHTSCPHNMSLVCADLKGILAECWKCIYPYTYAECAQKTVLWVSVPHGSCLLRSALQPVLHQWAVLSTSLLYCHIAPWPVWKIMGINGRHDNHRLARFTVIQWPAVGKTLTCKNTVRCYYRMFGSRTGHVLPIIFLSFNFTPIKRQNKPTAGIALYFRDFKSSVHF